MAATSTLSPDSIHGGPAIATLSGIFKNDGDKSCIDRGDIFRIDTGTTPPTFSFKGGTGAGNIAIAAEAVTLTHNQLKHSKDGGYLVHIPVVVFGRTMVNCKNGTTATYHGGDMAYIGSDFKVTGTAPTANTGYRITFLHPDEIVNEKESPKEVFVEPYKV